MIDPASVRTLTGRCTCGAVRYAVPDAFEYALNCHCTDCRRVTGAAFKSFAGIRRDRFSYTVGADQLWIRGDGDHACDVRCGICGSFLLSVVREGAFVHIAMGTLDDAPTIRPGAHIFVASKAPWFTITDGLPQYPGHVAAAAEQTPVPGE